MQRVAIAVLMMAVMTACGGGGDGTTAPTPPPVNVGVATVTVSLSPAQITVGTTATATAELRSGAGAVLAGRSVEWSSSAPAIASVNSAGVVSAIAAGSATITATSEGRSGSASLTVIPAPVATVQVTLALPTLTLGTASTANAVLRDERGATLTGRAVAWSSSSPAVATVDNSGAITTLAVGITVITATSEGKSATALLTVLPVPVATITVTAPQSSLTVGSSTQAAAVTRSASGQVLTDRVITWSSSAPSVASVSSTGVILAIAPGAVTVSATSEGRTATLAVSVLAPAPAVVDISPAAVTLAPSQTASLSATVRDASGNVMTGQSVSWGTTSPIVATVSASGVVTGVTSGTATITATAGGKTGFATVTVRSSIATVTLSGSSRLKVGDSYVYTATTRLSDGTIVSRPVTWGIVETGRAVVTATGLVTPLQAGSFTIRVVIDGEGWTASYTAYDWTSFTSGGFSFAVLEADVSVIGRRGISTRPDLIIACSNTSGSFLMQVDTREFITENGTIAYSFDGAAPVSAAWRELSPEYKTLYHPGPNGSTKAFASQIAASRQFGFAFTEYLGTAKATIFRVTGLTPVLSPLFTLCPSNAIVAGAPSAGSDARPLESDAERVMAEYATARGRSAVRTVSADASARAVSGPGVGDRSELLREWPVWTGPRIETQQAKRLR
jgi:uncharacterized protein YjdB